MQWNISQFLDLTMEVIMAFRWHMGLSEETSMYNSLGKAMEEYNLTFSLIEADMEAAKLIEGTGGIKKRAVDILPVIVERPAHKSDNSKPNPFD